MTYTKTQVRRWLRPGADGFFSWLQDVRPRVPAARGGFTEFKPERFQVDALRGALELRQDGDFRYTTLALSFPRRHSKTTLAALLCLWRLTTRPTENIVCLANSERQSVATGFGVARKILINTPGLLDMVGATNVGRDVIQHPELQGQMRTVAGGNVAGVYGERITVGWVTELHAAGSDEAMQVLASSLGDTVNSWLLVDSTVDGIGGPLHRLEQLHASGDDPTVYVCRREYADLEEALRESPAWIRRDWLRSRARQLLPATFATQHLNKRVASTSCLFAPEDIAACMERLPMPLTADALEEWAGGRAWAAGGGLDRAYFASLHGDKTIWTAVAKVAGRDGGESEYVILNQKSILGSLAHGIKRAITEDRERYRLENAVIEAYNAQDIGLWCQETGIPSEIVHATNTAQTPAFMELHRIVREHRLHFSDRLTDLADEMRTFLYDMVNGSPRFGSDKFHDDRVYSLAWAVYAVRRREMSEFELSNIICGTRSQYGRFCYLRGGDQILHCAKGCPTHIQVQGMFLQYRRFNVESEIGLPEFFHNAVKVNGARIYATQ